MKSLALVLLTAVACAAAAEPLPASLVVAPAAVAPALYSFSDLYRFTVGRAPVGVPPSQSAGEAPVRVAAVEAPAAEPRFSVRQFPAPARWLLVLAGLALAGWVAHRRLSYL
ncbi:MAG TPA: hypothetical protein VN675_15430 [Burkholderiales bacterium]|nr:hypothetical protein [Burkholderiales bacterium]